METKQVHLGFAENILIFAYSMIVVFCISYLLYFRRGGKKEFLFTYLATGAVVFQLCILLKTLTLDLGFAFGLFAVFSLIRYRANQVPMREMAYLFIVVGIAVLDGLVTDEPFHMILIWDMALVLIVVFAEVFVSKLRSESKLVTYEKVDLLQEDRYEELIADLEKRMSVTGIKKVKVNEYNFLRDTAQLVVYYKNRKGGVL